MIQFVSHISPTGWVVAVVLYVGSGFLHGTDAATRENPSALGGFDQYRLEIRGQLAQQRRFQSDDIETEIERNLPAEWRPDTGTGKGVILVHGLGDSPGLSAI
ncbi:hypothetical protein ACFQH7_22375 [Microbulbifer taiwanensis]